MGWTMTIAPWTPVVVLNLYGDRVSIVAVSQRGLCPGSISRGAKAARISQSMRES